MAKVKKEVIEEEKSEVSIILREIKKKYGDIIKSGTDILQIKRSLKTVSIGPVLDIALKGGIREGTWITMSGKAKMGKEQPISSIVYTPTGPVTMGDIKVGDEVCTPDGTTGYVIGVYPQGIKDIYKITFNDMSYVECGLDHLWQVYLNNTKYEKKILRLADFKDDLKLFGRQKWAISTTNPVFFDEQQIPMDPYLLGALLGDGGFRDNHIMFSNIDIEVLERVKSLADKYDTRLIFVNGSNCDYRITKKDMTKPHAKNKLKEDIKSLGLLNLTSHDKFIPNSYIYNTIEVRKEIIRGLFDTDGCNVRETYIEYSTVSEKLKNNVSEICRSLGYVVRSVERYTKSRGKKFKSFRVTIHGNSIKDLFYISRKSNFGDRTKNKLFRRIMSVELVRQEESKCIEIDHLDHLYLTNNYTPTHNTSTLMQLAYNCQKEGRPVIYINSEGRLSEMNFAIEGLDPSKMIIITAEDKPISAEAFLDITLQLISAKENEGALCIIDSVSSLVPSKEIDEDVSGSMRPGLPKILSSFVKKAGQIVPNNKIIMALVTHMITNTSGWGPATMADSGVKIQYQSDTRLEIKSIEPWVNKEVQIGQAVTWKILWSSMGATAVECKSWIRYGKGIDNTEELLVLGEELWFVGKTGAWYTCEFLKSDPLFEKLFRGEDPEKFCKFQGQEKTYNFLDENKEVLELLNKKIKEMLV